MTVDQRLYIGNEVKKFEVKLVEEEAPPIPLWKVGAVLLTLIGVGAGIYFYKKKR